MNISRLDRLKLSLQYQILAALRPNEKDWFERAKDIVEQGYVRDYEDLFNTITKEELSKEKCDFVWKVLSLYRSLQIAREELPNGGGLSEHDVVFMGFDGNNEIDHWVYVKHVLADRYTYELLKRTPDLNSHSRKLEIYNRMIDAWMKSGERDRLTQSDVDAIMSARAS